MNYEAMFNMLDEAIPQQETGTVDSMSSYEPSFQQDPWGNPQDTFAGFKTRPVLYNLDGYISPYASNNWGGTSNILQFIDDSSRLPAFENKIDPNKIFSSEITALKALAADQQKITKMFEKKLIESLTERGKVGLTEADVEAMSALTSARSAITSIKKEEVNIKKNITDIRIKQSQNNTTASNNTNTGPRTGGTMDIGRSILDSIFDAPSTPVQQVSDNIYQAASASDAARVIDQLVPTTGSHLQFESSEPTTYVVIGDSDDDIEFVTYSDTGEIIPDFPNPNARITTIDRDAGKATDEFLVQYPIKSKY